MFITKKQLEKLKKQAVEEYKERVHNQFISSIEEQAIYYDDVKQELEKTLNTLAEYEKIISAIYLIKEILR